MHYINKNVFKDIINILLFLKNNLKKCSGIEMVQLFKKLGIDNEENDYEYGCNLITMMEDSKYIEVFDLEEGVIIKITIEGIIMLEEYEKRSK